MYTTRLLNGYGFFVESAAKFGASPSRILEDALTSYGTSSNILDIGVVVFSRAIAFVMTCATSLFACAAVLFATIATTLAIPFALAADQISTTLSM
jgi:hypothetical protein